MVDEQQISGVERAAIFLLSLGEDSAASILRHLDPMEVQNVGEAMAGLNAVSTEKVTQVVGDFTRTLMSGSQAISGTDEYIKRMLYQALGEDKAKSMLGRILQSETRGLEAMKWMEAKAVAQILKDEHPQICAIVLLSLESEHSAEVLKLLPSAKRPEIMMRVASLDAINPDALDELDEMMQKQLVDTANSSRSNVDGVRIAAQILNHMDSNAENEIMESIEGLDKDMSLEIRDKMFIFENLAMLDNKDMQRLLRETETDYLVLSLKAAEEGLRDKFYNNMSRRAADMLREDIQLLGPVKLSEVETAQKEILNVAARLAAEGDIAFGHKSDDEYV